MVLGRRERVSKKSTFCTVVKTRDDPLMELVSEKIIIKDSSRSDNFSSPAASA